MQAVRYRALVIGGVLSWFLVGLHVPLVHQIAEHGRVPRWPVVLAVVVIVLAAAVTLGKLLRTPLHSSR